MNHTQMVRIGLIVLILLFVLLGIEWCLLHIQTSHQEAPLSSISALAPATTTPALSQRFVPYTPEGGVQFARIVGGNSDAYSPAFLMVAARTEVENAKKLATSSRQALFSEAQSYANRAVARASNNPVMYRDRGILR